MTRLKVKESPHGIAARTSSGADAVPVTSSDGPDALPIRLTNDPSAWPVAYDMHAFYQETGISSSGSALYLMTDERRNLIGYSEDFGNAAWTKTACTVAEVAETPPASGMRVWRKTPAIGQADPYLQRAITVLNGVQYTYSIWILSETGDIECKLSRTGGGTDITLHTPAQGVWTRITNIFTANLTGSVNFRLDAPNFSAGSGAETFLITGAMVNEGATAQTYSPTGDKQQITDYSGNGYHGYRGSSLAAASDDPFWTGDGLSFDGVNDKITSGVTLGATWSKIWRKDGDTYAATSAGATYLNGVSSVFTVPVFETGGSYSGTLGPYIPLPGQTITEAQALGAHTWLEANT